MNNNIPVPKGLLKLHATLTHNIYDQGGHLLLRAGTAIESDDLIERLEEKGYFDPEAVEALKGASRPVDEIVTGYRPDRSGAARSVVAELSDACGRLQAAFADHGGAFDSTIRAIADTVWQCCTLDSDASLSTLLITMPYPYQVRHPVNVATLAAVLIARQKQTDAQRAATLCAALTMDIGALDLHDDLYCDPRVATDPLRQRILGHAGAGVQALLDRGVRDPLWLATISQHHEALDGSGFPAGLKADKIRPEAQVLALADRYCGLTSERPHCEARLPPDALKAIHTQYATQVAPALVGALVSAIGVYPPGMFVRLANRETAVVVHRLLDPKHPVVYAICGPSGAALETPRKRLTASQAAYAIVECLKRTQVSAPIAPEQLWPPTIALAPPAAHAGAAAAAALPAGA
jgi:HD-GYP domain-containing protein (c-di-GMP phosphodiesterase class II)